MREIAFCLTLLLLQIGLAFCDSAPSGSDRGQQEGPSMPGGNSSEWAYLTRNARGPTGHCEDPNPRPDRDTKGILFCRNDNEPNGPDRPFPDSDNGPTGPSWQYWVSLTEDHYAGPNGVD